MHSDPGPSGRGGVRISKGLEIMRIVTRYTPYGLSATEKVVPRLLDRRSHIAFFIGATQIVGARIHDLHQKRAFDGHQISRRNTPAGIGMIHLWYGARSPFLIDIS